MPMKISSDMRRKLDLIRVLSTAEQPSIHDLHRETKIPEPTIKRQLAAMRREFGMRILFVRDTGGERGATGYYMLMDWGIIDQDAFHRRYPEIVAKAE